MSEDDDCNLTFNNRDEENLSDDAMDQTVKVFESVQLPKIGRYGLATTRHASISKQKAENVHFRDGMKYYATFIRSVEEDPIYHFYGARRRKDSARHAATKPSTSYHGKKMISLLQAENESRSMPKVIPETSINLEFDTFTGQLRHKMGQQYGEPPK